MKRHRTAEDEAMNTAESHVTPATSPETQRSKRSDSDPPSGKQSRLLPSTPLHMTTRAASRAATGSAANSVASINSRRSSLAGSPFGSGSDDEDRPVKRRRRSLTDEEFPNIVVHTNGEPREFTTERHGDEQVSEVGRDSDSPNKPSRPSENVLDSIEATPKQENDGDERSQEEQDNIDDLPIAKRPGRGKHKGKQLLAVQAPAYTPSDASALNSPVLPIENGDVSNGHATGQAAEKPAKRLPGRRRAPHANVNIEADLRRQLSLKMGYRAVVKQLKPILAELTRRSIEQVDEDPEAHEQNQHYQEVQDELDSKKQSRLDQLQHYRLYARAQEERLLLANRTNAEENLRNRMRDLQEDYEARAKERILRALRANAAHDDADATEDEDGPVPPLRAPASRNNDSRILANSYESRSRRFREVERLWEQQTLQHGVASKRGALIEQDGERDNTTTYLSGFATYEPVEREVLQAAKRRQALFDAVDVCSEEQTAVDLAAEIESRKTKDGLDILATASEQQRHERPKQQTLTTPRTPKTIKPAHSRRESIDDRKPLPEELSAAPSSSKRRDSRTLRSRESSPIKHIAPDQTHRNGAENTRMSSNKIADLLNNDQPQQLPTIAESSPAVASSQIPQYRQPPVIKHETFSRQPDQKNSNSSRSAVQDRFSYNTGSVSERLRLADQPPSSSKTEGRPPTAHGRDQHAPHHGDRRASESAAQRARLEDVRSAGSVFSPTIDSRPTTFDGSGGVISPTYTLPPSFHSRTSSLGARPGSFTPDTRDTVVPPQMSSRTEGHRDPFRPMSIDPGAASARHSAGDTFFRRSEPSTPAGPPFGPFMAPLAPPPYAVYGPYPPAIYHQQPPPLAPRYPPLPSYASEKAQGEEAPAAAQNSPPEQRQQERDVWRHHSYSRGGRR